MIILLFAGANMYLYAGREAEGGRPCRVEVNRISKEIEQEGLEAVDLSRYEYVTRVERCKDTREIFSDTEDSDSLFREINGEIYRFDHKNISAAEYDRIILMVNLILAAISLVTLSIIFYIRQKILKPFEKLLGVPYELSRGNLSMPIKEEKSRLFGKFLWGMDQLRENIEQQKLREKELEREKKTLILSISHDIKTPLSAVKLYARALSGGLYLDSEKQKEIAEKIHAKADEIEGFVSQLVKASSEDFLKLEVKSEEFYLSQMMDKIEAYYKEKLRLVKIPFSAGDYSDCLLAGDLDRGIEVLQNVMENAVKYGDGHRIEIVYSEEEDCRLVTVRNSGCTLSESELPHIFDSFWRGSNAENSQGSGLGLYICRQIMQKMDGEIFAEIRGQDMWVTTVFRKAA